MKEAVRIGVIDDDKDLALNIQDILEMEGYHVDIVNSCGDALKLFSEKSFDLAVVDIKLPDMSGPELVRALKKITPETEYIMITGHAAIETAVESVQEKNVIGYETKPLNMDRFLSLLKQAISRRQAEKEVVKNVESLRQAEEIAQLGYFERNWQTGEGHWSDGFRKLLHVGSDIDCAHEEFMEYIHPDDKDRVAEHIRDSLEEKHPMDVEFRIVQTGGKVLHIHGIAKNVYDEKGKPLSTNGIFQDITKLKQEEAERRQLEVQLRQAHKMESIGVLAGGIAHEFNNILSIIIGNTELAMDDVLDWNPARSNLDEVMTASLRAKDVVRQLLSFTRKTEQRRGPLKIIPVVEDVIKFLRASIPSTIEIRFDKTNDPGVIMADPTQMNQVIINLCTNAAHAMEETGGVLEIGIRNIFLDHEQWGLYHEITPGPYLQLSIRDTGHGIDPEIKDKIFDPYFTTKEVGKGTGMGLAIVHSIVRDHGGGISVVDEPGEGTTFRVYLPQEDGELEKI